MTLATLDCPECEWQAQNRKALAAHVKKHHPTFLQALPPAPLRAPDRTILTPKRTAVYLRVSTVDQSPEQQLPKLEAFAGLHGLAVVETYIDKASGKNAQRPALQRLMEDAKTGNWDCVIYLRISRLGRNLRDVIMLWDYFERLGIATMSATEPFDTRTPAGRFQRTILAAVAEFEREMLVEQTKEKMAYMRDVLKQPVGRHPPGCGTKFKCPWGLDHSPLGVAKRYRAKGKNDKLNKLIRSGCLTYAEVKEILGSEGMKGVDVGADAPNGTPFSREKGVL